VKRLLPLFVFVALTLGALVPFFADAHHEDVIDPNDVDGLLDVRKVHVSPKDPPRYTFRTFGRWTTAEVWDYGYFLVHFDSNGDSHFDYYVVVRSNGNELLGSLWRDRKTQEDYKVGGVKVWRPDKNRVTVRVPLNRLKVREAYYRWYASSLYTGNSCPRTCIDRVPNRGSVEEPLVEPTPTETLPTPTLTVSPT
jgi:hypothetical protein